MTCVVNSHFAGSLRPIDVDLLLRFARERGHGHYSIIRALAAHVILRLQGASSHSSNFCLSS